MAQIVKRAYKYRFYPTEGQADQLARTLGCVRLVYDKALEEGDASVGVDVGLTGLATPSTGDELDDPRHEKRERHRLAKAQRALSRKQQGSANRAEARLRVARLHARIADRRRDFLHKPSTSIVRENQPVVIEDLPVANLLKNHTLARGISDAAWREPRAMLEYRCAWYGRRLVVADRRFPSSKPCSACGVKAERMPPDVREWTCACGTRHDRDVNAARNLLAAGRVERPNACGAGTRPHREPSGVGRSAGKQETRRATAGLPRLQTGEEVN